MNYYIVQARCGHLGHGRYIPISFPVRANDGEEAASLTKGFPRVKKNRKDSILSVTEVGYLAYQCQRVLNEMDPYLNVYSKREQDKIMPLIEHRIKFEEQDLKIGEKRRDSVKYKRRKNSLKWLDMETQINQYC